MACQAIPLVAECCRRAKGECASVAAGVAAVEMYVFVATSDLDDEECLGGCYCKRCLKWIMEDNPDDGLQVVRILGIHRHVQESLFSFQEIG